MGQFLESMSICTKRGDDGFTDLMYGRRVSKIDKRVVAYGSVDEVNASIGVARSFCRHDEIVVAISLIQDELIILMGELATAPEDHARYGADGFCFTSGEIVDRLTSEVTRLEEEMNNRFKGWAIPGKDATVFFFPYKNIFTIELFSKWWLIWKIKFF